MPDLGQSYSPANQGQVDPRLRKKTPVQQALQTLSLQMPAYTGGNAVSSDLLSGRSSGVRQAGTTPHSQTLINAMMSGQPSSTGGAGSGQGRANRIGGGFSGGGFGGGGVDESTNLPGMDDARIRAYTAQRGTQLAGVKDRARQAAQNVAGMLPNKGSFASAQERARTAATGVAALLPGAKGGFTVPPALMPKLPPKLAAPPINPNIPGGGLLDHAVSAPRPVAPPLPPKTNFARGSNDVRFNTPTAQLQPQVQQYAQQAAPPTPPPPNVVPIGAAGPNGNVYTGPPASGPQPTYGPPPGSGPPPQYASGYNPYGNSGYYPGRQY